MATDWWPDEEGALNSAEAMMIPAVTGAAVTEGCPCKFGTSASGVITIIDATALGDGWAVSTRAATAAAQAIPLMMQGLFKMTQSCGGQVIDMGEFVMNSVGYIVGVSHVGTYTSANLEAFSTSAASYLLGMAMQATTATADEIAVYIGKSP